MAVPTGILRHLGSFACATHHRRPLVRLSPAVQTRVHGFNSAGAATKYLFTTSRQINILAVPTGIEPVLPE